MKTSKDMVIWILIIFSLVLIACFFINKAIKKEKESRELEDANQRIIEEERRKKKRLEKEAKDLARKEKYGERSATLNYPGISINVYNSSKTIFINGKYFNFSEITGCDIREEKSVIPGYSTKSYTTKTSGSSMVGRALVGAIIAGPVGAAIGGITAKKETIQHTDSMPDIVKYTYYVTIGIGRKGWQDIVLDTSYNDRAEKVKRIIDKILKKNISQQQRNNI